MKEHLSEVPRLVKVACIVGLLLILIGSIMTISDAIDAHILQQRLANAEQTVTQLAVRLPQAQRIYDENWKLYADHWSAGIDSKLHQSTGYFSANTRYPHGQVNDLLAQAKKIASSDRAKARELLDQLEPLLQSTSQVVNMILGPPGKTNHGLYDQLAFKAKNAAGELTSAHVEINTDQQILLHKESEFWNISHNVTFHDAELQLERARNLAATADLTSTLKVERGLIDLPLAYDQAANAKATANNAIVLASQREQDARNAQSEIDSAQAHINSVSSVVATASYQRSLAQSQLQTAKNTLQSARTAFYRGDYSYVRSLASTAYSQATTAQATTVPPPPSSDNNNSSSSSSSWSHGSSGSGSGGSWSGGNSSSGGSWHGSGSSTGSWHH